MRRTAAAPALIPRSGLDAPRAPWSNLAGMRLLGPLVLLAACGASRAAPDATPVDASPPDSDPGPKSGACASTFGAELTSAFGRLDGTILAVVPPTNTTCAQINGTHLTLQLTMHGAAYRMVVNVLSTSADLRVFIDELDAPLVGGPWAEGWHTGIPLDYPTALGVASTAFTPHDEAETVQLLTDRLELGAHVSVFATSSGGSKADSAHLVHRHANHDDGAIVLDADTATPHYILFHFADQTF